jgi:hypothetical protein
MCEPATIMAGASLAVGATTSVMSILQQNKAASEMASSANTAAVTDYSILDRRQQEADSKSALEMTERQRQGLKERSKLMVAIGESGVSGNSPLREVDNALSQADYDLGIIGANQKSETSQIQDEKLGIYTQAQSRVNQAKSSYVNPLTGMLKIGVDAAGAGLAGYGMGMQLFPKNGSTSWKYTGGGANRALASAGGVH